MTYSKYEFTAFKEQDLLNAGDHNLGCGDTFTMPTTATVCLGVKDNDGYLSGDAYSRYDDRADDQYGQWAYIDGQYAGGRMYAEQYHVLKDAAGNKYFLIEIEIEGSNQDYFTYYGNVPAAGTELTIVKTCNVTSHCIDYRCLDAGAKEEFGSVSGTVFCDTDCDGINGSIQIIPGCDYTIEAEDMHLCGFHVVDGAHASGGKLVKLNCAGGDGYIKTHFNGKDGVYDLKIHVQDENDGQSKLKLFINGHWVEGKKIFLNNDNDGGGSNNGQFSTFVFEDVSIKSGDDLKIAAWGSGYEFVRIDKIELEGEDTEVYTPEPTKSGVTIKLVDAVSGDVVQTTTTDADGNYSFDLVPVGDYKVMGVAPDGTEFTIQDAGSNDAIDSDVDANGMSGTVTVTKDGNVDVDLGLKDKPEPGSLSGRYFCDENGDGLDNNGDPGVAGVVVMLLDSDGNRAKDINGVDIPDFVTTSDGNYNFANLAAGSYSVKFTDAVSGGALVAKDAGTDDTIDSDADDLGGGMSIIRTINVAAGQNTPDNDAGVTGTSSVGDTVWFDANRDGIRQSDERLADGVEVKLLADLDGDGQVDDVKATTTTANGGQYLFDGLKAGQYAIMFQEIDGFDFTTVSAGPDDATNDDSDAGAGGMTEVFTLDIGEAERDIDAGLVAENGKPTPMDDAATTCADDTVGIKVLENDTDPENDMLTVVAINGISVNPGDIVQLATVNGDVGEFLNVELIDDAFLGTTLLVDGEAAFASLDIFDTASETFTYTVRDTAGNEETANVTVTFKGDANSVASFNESLPTGEITYKIQASNLEFPVEDYAFNLQFLSTGDERFDNKVFAEAYCLDRGALVGQAEQFVDAPVNTGTLIGANEAGAADVFSADQTSFFNGNSAAENLDMITWILNQDFENNGFTGWEVQRAIWELTDDEDLAFLDTIINPGTTVSGFGSDANVDTILAQAAVDASMGGGEGFVAGVGDVIGVIVDPGDADPNNAQPFIVALPWEQYDCLCPADSGVFVCG